MDINFSSDMIRIHHGFRRCIKVFRRTRNAIEKMLKKEQMEGTLKTPH